MKIFKSFKSLLGFKQNSSCEAEIKKVETVSLWKERFKQKGEFSQKQTIYNWFVQNDNPYSIRQWGF